MDLMDIPPMGYYRHLKWKSYEDFRGRGKKIAKWVPRPDVRPLSVGERLRMLLDRPPLRGVEEVVAGTVLGRAILTLTSPSGDLIARAVADNVITTAGKEFIKNAMRAAVAGFNVIYDINTGSSFYESGYAYAKPASALTNSPRVSGNNVFGLLVHNSLIRGQNGEIVTSQSIVYNPFRYMFLSTVTAAEDANENTVLSGTYSPVRQKDYASNSNLSYLNPASGWDGNGNLYLRWDYSTGEAIGTWNSVHLAYNNVATSVQGARNLLVSPVVKNNTMFLKVEYTIAITLS